MRVNFPEFGHSIDVPDNTPDSEIQRLASDMQFSKAAQVLGPATAFAQQLVGPMAQQTESTLPNMGAGDVIGMTPQQVTQTAGIIQNDNQSRLQQKMQRQQAVQRGLEAEKDRAQEIKLQQQQMKNQIQLQKMQQDWDKQLAEMKAKAAESDREDEQKFDLEKLNQQHQNRLAELGVQNQGRMDYANAIKSGSGGGGGTAGEKADSLTGKAYTFDTLVRAGADPTAAAEAAGLPPEMFNQAKQLVEDPKARQQKWRELNDTYKALGSETIGLPAEQRMAAQKQVLQQMLEMQGLDAQASTPAAAQQGDSPSALSTALKIVGNSLMGSVLRGDLPVGGGDTQQPAAQQGGGATWTDSQGWVWRANGDGTKTRIK